MTELAVTDPLPKPKRDLLPVLLPVILALAMLPLCTSPLRPIPETRPVSAGRA